MNKIFNKRVFLMSAAGTPCNSPVVGSIWNRKSADKAYCHVCNTLIEPGQTYLATIEANYCIDSQCCEYREADECVGQAIEISGEDGEEPIKGHIEIVPRNMQCDCRCNHMAQGDVCLVTEEGRRLSPLGHSFSFEEDSED